ncbi:GNAT family N-acetyltransferase [Clostridium tagluense]|uniref:GNAT family N-acetyltransferase n=1 Tax=Clostridium tagluense TaxID=360422 RepID=UPI001C0CAD19|nr:GNAT family N-acetyltransferase [Clostridium tagluense]MBU3129377.1 GNAT family N-acetyltransferase [Clostridium tagluense]MCB2310720.1 GNAT family N-acetyltransferase [Clostridium tagluense]MCB2315550.1 GNAT family N-acetyltransferase [Clostridium tagluense]MCB2320404.1 GNAT family N-acetyltransferase [Clostridium tagluense]MCB2325313.1 GNAT family N-acetyltransferase [Clostridium tagluense]
MSDYTIISDYMNNDKYRRSFNKLSMDIFESDPEKWYGKKIYYNRCKFYSCLYEDEVVASISVNNMDLLVEGEKKTALQLSGIMTHPNHRNKGLSAALINHIIEKYENEYDIIYLFANDSVLNFYQKFGFKQIIEAAYELDENQINRKESMIRKLKTHDENDCNTILRIIENRQAVSKKLGVFNDLWPLHIFCMYVHTDDMYYLEEEDTIVIATREDGCMHIYDILSLTTIDLDSIIEKIVTPEDKKIEFHFIPESNKYSILKILKQRPGDWLFVRTNNTLFNEVLFPLTSQT